VPETRSDPPHVTLFVCTTCRRTGDAEDAPRAGATLATAATALAGPDLAVRPVECLGNCSRGPTAAVVAHGGWTYVFGALDPAEGAAALQEGARLLAGAAGQVMPWRGRPEALKRGLIARIPPLEHDRRRLERPEA
jgi:predicted metal-binding protein